MNKGPTLAEFEREQRIAAENAASPAADTTEIAISPLKPGELPYQPMDGYLVVRPCAPLKVTKGGIHMPDSSVKNPNQGVVMALGDVATRADGTPTPWKIAVGDTVAWRDIAAYRLEHEGELFLVMGSEDITLKAVSR